jgi:hypothetical protein
MDQRFNDHVPTDRRRELIMHYDHALLVNGYVRRFIERTEGIVCALTRPAPSPGSSSTDPER